MDAIPNHLGPWQSRGISIGDDGEIPERLEDAAKGVKAATTAMRIKNKFTVPDEVREMASEAAKCRDPVRRKLLRQSARKAPRDFEAGRAALPRGTVIHNPVVTKLLGEWTGLRGQG